MVVHGEFDIVLPQTESSANSHQRSEGVRERERVKKKP